MAVSGDDSSVVDLSLYKAFATVPLSREPITAFIFWIWSSILLRGFALTYYSETPHTK
jgi:hypothetical protein